MRQGVRPANITFVRLPSEPWHTLLPLQKSLFARIRHRLPPAAFWGQGVARCPVGSKEGRSPGRLGQIEAREVPYAEIRQPIQVLTRDLKRHLRGPTCTSMKAGRAA